jgi:hypothetical protein
MIWPTMCVDNFFDNPNEIIELSKKCTFKPISNAPGTRSEPLHIIDPKFSEYLCTKMLSLYYPNDIENVRFYAISTFQKVPANLKFDNWVHKDDNYEITALIYLNEHTDSGTSLFNRKKLKFDGIQYSAEKNKYFNDNNETKDLKKFRDLNNNSFNETSSFKGIYNRLVMFDGSNFHASHIYNDKQNRDRLTLITFFKKIELLNTDRSNYPIPTSKRI